MPRQRRFRFARRGFRIGVSSIDPTEKNHVRAALQLTFVAGQHLLFRFYTGRNVDRPTMLSWTPIHARGG